jgi:hypothetical protein
MNTRIIPFQPSRSELTTVLRDRDPAVYTHPDEVLLDTALTVSEKQALLASWISDARAVEHSPALRRLDSGAVVDVDVISRALMSLDAGALTPSDERKPTRLSHQRRGVVSKWLSRAGPSNGGHDDDDDPPPSPAPGESWDGRSDDSLGTPEARVLCGRRGGKSSNCLASAAHNHRDRRGEIQPSCEFDASNCRERFIPNPCGFGAPT